MQQQLVHVATLCGHSGSVTAVVGRYTVYGTNTNERIICATASADSTVKIWAQCVESGKFLFVPICLKYGLLYIYCQVL